MEIRIEDADRDCSQCGKRFAHPSHLKRHMLSHESRRNFTCTICNKAFKQKAHLKRHALTSHAKLLNPELVSSAIVDVCLCCGKSFPEAWLLARHCRSVHAGAGLDTGHTIFNCPHCDQRDFPSQKDLNNHLEQHAGLRPFPCGMCRLAFRTRAALEYHSTSKHNTSFPSWRCRPCGDAFVQRSQVERHWNAVHRAKDALVRVPAKPYQRTLACRFCSAYSAGSAVELKKHICDWHFYRERSTTNASNEPTTSQPLAPCQLTLVITMQPTNRPTSRLNLHRYMPEDVLRQFPELSFCAVELGAVVQPGATLVLELQTHYASGCRGPRTLAHRIAYGH